jgi:hypothetical protein
MTGLSQSFGFRDSKGQTASLRVYMISGADSDANYTQEARIATDLAALTNAVVETAKGPYTKAPVAVGYGAAATYEDVEDKAVMTFATGFGAIHRFEIPAPLSAIFMADGETVDPTNVNVKHLVADMINSTYSGTAPNADITTAHSDRNGQALTTWYGGVRARRKMRRRVNIFTKNPALTGPDE